MSTAPSIAVYGAYGHTGRLVLTELRRTGLAVRALGRDPVRLADLARDIDVPWHAADVDVPDALDAALDGADALVACAGPFGATAAPLLDAAIRNRVCYFDTCAEPGIVQSQFETRWDAVRDAGIVAVPCLGFYGAIADWAVAHLARDVHPVDSVHVAYALDEWVPTPGSRAAAATLGGRRWVVDDGRLDMRLGAAPLGEHHFGGTVGLQKVLAEYPAPEVVLLHHRAAASSVRSSMSIAGLKRLVGDATTETPSADLRNGAFRIEVRIAFGSTARSIAFSGADLYALTAPIVAHAVHEVRRRRGELRGLLTPAQAVGAESALSALSSITVITEPCSP